MDSTFIISPPAGRWFHPSWATPVLGSFTASPRPGRLRQVLRTVRPTHNGWRNAVGLRNPGIRSIKRFKRGVIYSFAGFTDDDWILGLHAIPRWAWVEMNIGCPNAGTSVPDPAILMYWTDTFPWVSVKLPAIWPVDGLCRYLVDNGVRVIHACNSVLEDGVAHSGGLARAISRLQVAMIRENWPDLTIIAGGGIYGPEDVAVMRDLGADKFSLCTGLMRPWRVGAMREAAGP